MKYNGLEVKEFTSDKPVAFDPPKKMLVCDTAELLGDENIDTVYAYIPAAEYPVKTGRNCFYRCAEIPEEAEPRRATNLELIKWLAQGNGLCKHRLDSMVQCIAKCDKVELDNECSPNWNVCKWDDTEWHEPTVDYMGLEG